MSERLVFGFYCPDLVSSFVLARDGPVAYPGSPSRCTTFGHGRAVVPSAGRRPVFVIGLEHDRDNRSMVARGR